MPNVLDGFSIAVEEGSRTAILGANYRDAQYLYEQIGDTVIEMQDDGTPVLIEDYLDDLKGMLET